MYVLVLFALCITPERRGIGRRNFLQVMTYFITKRRIEAMKQHSYT